MENLELVPFRSASGNTNEDPDLPSSNCEEVVCISAFDPSLQMRDSNSSVSLASLMTDSCRICHCESEPGAPLISPCSCSGTLKFVHQSCLQHWIKNANTKSCELCKREFQMTTSIQPFRKWEKLEMTKVERRKLICSVTFHVIAITCVVWSLYVLIDRTTEEVKAGVLEWPFWTKLIVVAIGFTGGLVFMYVQCKMYVQLCQRWKAYNRIIYVQNCPNLPRGGGRAGAVAGSNGISRGAPLNGVASDDGEKPPDL